MPGTKEGAIKARDTMLKRDPNYFSKLGVIGGNAMTEGIKRRGFASMDKKRLRKIASRGGTTKRSK